MANTLSKSAHATFCKLVENMTQVGDHKKFSYSGQYMPVSVEVIGKMDNGLIIVSVAQYGKPQNGDAMRDPEMTFAHHPGATQALTFRNDYIGVNQVAKEFLDGGKRERVNPGLLSQINVFAGTWMRTIKQDHRI